MNVFYLFISPVVEQISTPSTQECFLSSLVKIGPVALERSLFRYYLPLGEVYIHLNIDLIESPSPKDILCQVCLKADYTGDSREKYF